MSTVSGARPTAHVPPAIILPPELEVLVAPLQTVMPSHFHDGEGGLVPGAEAWLHARYLRQVFVYERADKTIVYEPDSARAPSNAVVKNICFLCDYRGTSGRFDRHVGSETHRKKIVDALELRYGPPSIVYVCEAEGCRKEFYRDDLCSEHIRSWHGTKSGIRYVKTLRTRTEMPKASRANRMRRPSSDKKRPRSNTHSERPTKHPKIEYPYRPHSPPSPSLSSSSSTSFETSPPTTPLLPSVSPTFVSPSSISSVAKSSEVPPLPVLSTSKSQTPVEYPLRGVDSDTIDLLQSLCSGVKSKTEGELSERSDLVSPLSPPTNLPSCPPAVTASSAAEAPESTSSTTDLDVAWTADAVTAVIELLSPSAMDSA